MDLISSAAGCTWKAASLCLAMLICHPALHAQPVVCDKGDRDWEQVAFGLTLPSPLPVDFSRLSMPLIERHYVGPYRMASQLVRGDFDGVQAHWDGIAAMPDRTEQLRATLRSLDMLEGRGLSALHQAQAWHSRNPQSPAAQLVLAAAWTHAAYEAHNDRYVPERAGGYFHRPRQRALQALPLVDALKAQGGFYGMVAREVELPARWLLDETQRASAWSHYLALIEYAPHAEALYLRAASHAGRPADQGAREQRFAQLRSTADRLGLPPLQRRSLEQTLDEYVRQTAKDPNPQTWRPYWDARVKIAPTLDNLAGWLEAEHRASNWTAVVTLADRMLALDAHYQRALERKSWALRQQSRNKEAFDAAFAAMMLGSDWAMNQIVQAHVHGGLGMSSKDHESLYAHCRLGASLGLASAAHCMGSAHTEGFAGVPRSEGQALAWHLLGARGGQMASAHDLVVLLPRVVTDPARRADVELASAHWIRKAASHEHPAAQARLAARPEVGLLCLPGDGPSLLQRLYQRLRGGQ
jgi:hypothetical protein